MASSKATEYVLPSDSAESKRLNLQHEGFVASTGYLLHPRISSILSDRASPVIADIATGTGVWLLALESEISSTLPSCSFYGLDISAAQFPSASSTRCNFETLDLRHPVPKTYKNFFDVVHIRMVLGGLTTPDWSVAARNVLDLLKPGGWIQWHELDAESTRAYPTGPGPAETRGSEILLHHFTKGFQRWGKFMAEDMPVFRQRLEDVGFEHVDIHRPSSDRVVEMRAQISIAMCKAVGQALQYLAKTDLDCGLSVDEAETIAARSMQELESGLVYWRWDMYVLTAQKPAGKQ